MDQVYYCCGIVNRAIGVNAALPATKDASHEATWHFYLTARDATDAGAIAHDICREENASLVEYLQIPVALKQADVIPYPEHLNAFQLAILRGACIVTSYVFEPRSLAS